MNPNLCPVITAMAKLGLRHSVIAHSLGMSTRVLRLYFARELTQIATEAELEALSTLQTMAMSKKNTTATLSHLKMHQPPPPKPTSSSRINEDDECRSIPFEVYNNEGEPNYPY